MCPQRRGIPIPPGTVLQRMTNHVCQQCGHLLLVRATWLYSLRIVPSATIPDPVPFFPPVHAGPARAPESPGAPRSATPNSVDCWNADSATSVTPTANHMSITQCTTLAVQVHLPHLPDLLLPPDPPVPESKRDVKEQPVSAPRNLELQPASPSPLLRRPIRPLRTSSVLPPSPCLNRHSRRPPPPPPPP